MFLYSTHLHIVTPCYDRGGDYLFRNMSTPTILVVEDDASIRQGIVDALSFSGYEVLVGKDGKEGMELALGANYQLLLLDLVMPHFSGFDILQALQNDRPGQPTIVLSARGEENDRVKGLSMGADDYVVKPFSVRELLARVDAVLRRSSERSSKKEVITLGDISINTETRIVTLPDSSSVELSDKELDVLNYLLMADERLVTRDELLKRVWKLDAKNIETRTIDMHIARLRQKLQDTEQSMIVTVRGRGYQLIQGDSKS